jgi:hypothetical protein
MVDHLVRLSNRNNNKRGLNIFLYAYHMYPVKYKVTYSNLINKTDDFAKIFLLNQFIYNKHIIYNQL